MTTWKHLTQTHDTYDPKLWSLLETLYEGGFKVSDAFKTRVLEKHPNESAELFKARKKSASYLNYFGQVVDFFAAKLFIKQLTVIPTKDGENAEIDMTIYDEFAEDADGEGNDFQQLMAKCFITAVVMNRAVVAVDFPAAPNVEVVNAATEEALGLTKPKAFWIHPAMLLDYKLDDKGRYVFAVLHRQFQDRATFDDDRDVVVDQFKVWEMRGQALEGDDEGMPTGEQRAHFRVFELRRTEKEAQNKPKPEENIPEVIPLTQTSFKRIPLVAFELPLGLWVGNKVGPLVLEHFSRRTELIAAQNKSLMAIPVVKLGSEMGAPRREMPSDVQQDPSRGMDPAGSFKSKGWVRIGSDDDMFFAEPAGNAYKITSEQLKELVDEIFRVSHQMAQSISATSQALSRSGFSKAEDRNVSETVLEAFGEKVSQFAVRIYDIIAEALGDDVFWTAHGLSDFRVSGDRAQAVEEAGADLSKKVPSKTFRKRYHVKLALRLLGDNLSPEDEQAIRKEIESAVDAEPDPAEVAANPPVPPQLPANGDKEEGGTSHGPGMAPNQKAAAE